MAVVLQVADDLNRMTNYIEDLRNMLVGLVALSILGALIFLFLQRRNGRKSSRESRKLVSFFLYLFFKHKHTQKLALFQIHKIQDKNGSKQSSLKRGHPGTPFQKPLEWSLQNEYKIEMEPRGSVSSNRAATPPPLSRHQQPQLQNDCKIEMEKFGDHDSVLTRSSPIYPTTEIEKRLGPHAF